MLIDLAAELSGTALILRRIWRRSKGGEIHESDRRFLAGRCKSLAERVCLASL